MESVKFIKTFVCQVPVYIDGVKTEDKEPRVKAMFVREVTTLGGLSTTKQYGSMFLNREVTEEQAHEVLSTESDYVAELKFIDVEGSDFYKVVAK